MSLAFMILLPPVILTLAAVGMIILQQTRPSIGYSWLIATLTGVLVTGIVLFLRTRLPSNLVIDPFRPFPGVSSPPAFVLDYTSWPYSFCLVVVCLAFLLTDAARLETEARPINWAVGLILTGAGLLGVMAGNPLTLVVIWTMIDLIELIMVLGTDAGRRMGQQTVTVFSIRFSGQVIVLLAILYARSQGIPFDLNPIPGPLAIFMLIAAGLRLGVLPLNVPYTREVYTWRGLGNVMRMIGPASSLMVLGRMPEQVVPEAWRSFFLGFTVLAALYGGAMWLTAERAVNGRSYWIISLAALAIASVLNGNAQGSVAWGTTLLLPGSFIFFYSARRRMNMTLPILTMLGLIGLPFSPTATGWAGIVGKSPGIYALFFLFAVVMLIWGYWRLSLQPRDELHRMERWVHTVYPLGLFFLILAQWVIGVFGWPGSLTLGVWPAATAVFIIALAGIVFTFRYRAMIDRMVGEKSWFGVVARRSGTGINAFFRLNWLYRILVWIYSLVESVVDLVTEVFEGDGGVLWALVMLAILISLIQAGGVGSP